MRSLNSETETDVVESARVFAACPPRNDSLNGFRCFPENISIWRVILERHYVELAPVTFGTAALVLSLSLSLSLSLYLSFSATLRIAQPRDNLPREGTTTCTDLSIAEHQ